MRAHIDSFKKQTPKIHETAFIAPTSSIIGQVEIHENASIWYGCVLRGDIEKVVVGKNSNIQDGSVLHVDYNTPCIVEEDVTVGHMAMLHACHIKRGARIGMGAIILSGAVVEEEAQVGAGALVAPGKVVPARTLFIGIPAVKKRDLTQKDVEEMLCNSKAYVALSREYLRNKNI